MSIGTRIGSTTRTWVYHQRAPEMLDASDHRSYWAQGWPAVLVTDTAFVRNPNYHTAHDRASTLDYPRMGRAVDGVANAVLHAAQLPSPADG